MYNPILRYILNNHFLATVLIIAAAIFLYQIKGIIVVLFVSFIIMAALEPFVKTLVKRGINKPLSVLLVYVSTLSVIVLLVLPLLPFFISQINTLFDRLPFYIKEISQILGVNISVSQINQNLNPNFSQLASAVSLTGRIFGGLFLTVTTFIISLYMLLYSDKVQDFVKFFVPRKLEGEAVEIEKKIKEKLGAWLRGQIFLSVVVGTLTYFALTIIGVDFALPLALLAGIFELIPTIGPIISAVPAVIVAFSISPFTAILTTIAYILIQVAEGNFLVPKVMQKAVGLNPIIVIVAILIGGNLLGIIGALLAVPFVLVLIILYQEIRNYQF